MTTSEKISIFLLLVTTFAAIEAQKNLNPVYQWKYPEYIFPNATVKSAAIASKEYIPENPVMIDCDTSSRYGTIFVTTPRFLLGVPCTLGRVEGTSASGGPLIAPYPSYEWQNSKNCNALISVFRVFVDLFERLWVLDSGVINDKQVCQAKLLIFDLNYPSSSPFVHAFDPAMYRNGSLFITIVVDPRNKTDSMAYIADVTGFQIIVFDLKYNLSWRTQSQLRLLDADSRYSKFTIASESFNLMDGIFGMAVSPKNYLQRQLFCHGLASAGESRIALNALDTCNLWPPKNPVTNPDQYWLMGNRETTQTTAQAMDANGNLFFGTIFPPGIGCWDSTTLYNNTNLRLVARNDETMQFTSGLKIVTLSNGVQELWALSCRFQKTMAGTRKMNETNYRIQKMSIPDLLNGDTRCRNTIGSAMPRQKFP